MPSLSNVLSLHHFSFEAPGRLLVLLVVPLFYLFAALIRRRRSRDTVAFTNLKLLGEVTAKRRTRWAWRRPVVLLALALAVTAAALARPSVQVVASDPSATIVLLADVSGSMEATDVLPERIFAAVNAMHQFIGVLPANNKVGLVTFSDKVDVLHAPTTDHGAVDSALDVLSPEGGTALGLGVQASVKLILASFAAAGVRHSSGQLLPAAIVLESDGAQNRGSITPLAAAGLAKAAGIRIYGVALGTRHGFITTGTGLLTKSIRVLPDPGTVALLARETGGQAYSATNASKLDTIYRQLGASIGRHRVRKDITSWFEIAAAVLLIAAVGTARSRGGALP